jgi:hypothetical protein
VLEFSETVIQSVFNKFDAFTAQRFTATEAPPVAKRTQILPMT